MNEVLLLTIGFSPNIGGIETHFDDLVSQLKNNIRIKVLTYKPLTTNVSAKIYEKRNENVEIIRIPVFRGIFYKFLNSPFIEFMLLTPGLFIVLPLLLLTIFKDVKTIHSHGLLAGFVGVFWGKIFRIKVITTTHSIYNFPKSGLYRNFAKWIFSKSDHILTLSKQSRKEIEDLGVNQKKISVFTYWVDLNKFRPDKDAKKKLGWNNKFTVLFVGRLVEEKGVLVLLDAAKKWDKNITLVIIGTGPLEEKVKHQSSMINNLIYLGKIDNDDLPLYYSAADLLTVPSTHEEGFGRVILESLACGTPVIGSNRGAIPEAINKSVGTLIDVNVNNIKNIVEYYYKNSGKLDKLRKNTRSYAMKKYSKDNIKEIVKYYE